MSICHGRPLSSHNFYSQTALTAGFVGYRVKIMAIQENTSLLHWNYFLALESDVERLSRFVEFTPNNFQTYSIEIAHLFLAASSEVDVIARQICSRVDASAKARNILQYRNIIKTAIPELESSIVTIPRYGLELRPWINWCSDTTPNWWNDHNKVKHQRNEYFPSANLKNVLNAMAGLFMLTLHHYREIIEGRRIEPPPNLFNPPPELAIVCPTYGGRMALSFKE